MLHQRPARIYLAPLTRMSLTTPGIFGAAGAGAGTATGAAACMAGIDVSGGGAGGDAPGSGGRL